MKREKERRLTYLLAHFSPVVIAIPSSTFGGGAYLPVDHPQLAFASERVVVTRDAAVADPIEKKTRLVHPSRLRARGVVGECRGGCLSW
jgi:hypothetical protein